MHNVTQCPTCGLLLETKDLYKGKLAQCPECEELFTILPFESLEGSDAPTNTIPPDQADISPDALRDEILSLSESAPPEPVPSPSEAEPRQPYAQSPEASTLPVEAPTDSMPSQRGKILLIIGSIAAVLLLAIVIAVVMNSGASKSDSSSSKSTEVAQTAQNTGNRQLSPKPEQRTRKMTVEQLRKKEESSYVIAKASFDNEDYGTAVSKLQEFIEKFPNSVHQLEMKKILLKAKDVLRKRQEAEKKAADLYSKGEKAFKREDYEAAIAKLSQVPKDTKVGPKAERLLRKVKTEHAQNLYNRAKKALDEKRYRDAAELFERVIKEYSKSKWASLAKVELDTANKGLKNLVVQIASDAWSLYPEYKRLKRAGWTSDKTKKIEDLSTKLKGWNFSPTPEGYKLSKGNNKVDFVERKDAESKTRIYLSKRAREQIGEKVLAGNEWLSYEEVKKRGYIKLGNRWFKPMDLLKQQVVQTHANVNKFFNLRRNDIFDKELKEAHGSKVWEEARKNSGLVLYKDRRDKIRIFGDFYPMLNEFKYKISKFQPDSDKIPKGNDWTAAKATVTVDYQLNIPIYEIGKIIKGQKEDHIIGIKKKIETISRTYICLLIRESKDILDFLESKRQDGVPRFKFDDGIYKTVMDQGQQTYYQSACFRNSKYHFVIAIIYKPEFDKVFKDITNPGKDRNGK